MAEQPVAVPSRSDPAPSPSHDSQPKPRRRGEDAAEKLASYTLPLPVAELEGMLIETLATARALGVPAADAARGLAAMPVPSMRTAWTTLGAATLINDAYNANPESMRAALATLAAMGGRHTAVLGAMAELGADADAAHAELGRLAELNDQVCTAAGIFTVTELDGRRIAQIRFEPAPQPQEEDE